MANDLFCWKCHEISANINCNSCKVSYHSNCVNINPNNNRNVFTCVECNNDSNNKVDDQSSQLFDKLLLFSYQMIKTSADYYFRTNYSKDESVDQRIVNPMDLNIILNKINGKKYKCFKQLVTDFKWILHNSIVRELDSEVIENAKFLLSKAKEENRDYTECINCVNNYYTSDKIQYYSWFSKPCLTPHIMVWAKVRGHPYWPAKAIKHIKTGDKVSVLVRFFGTHEKSWVQLNNCYELSKDVPKQKKVSNHDLFEESLKEMRFHIQYLNKEFPNAFQFAKNYKQLSITNLIAFQKNEAFIKSNESCINDNVSDILINDTVNDVKHKPNNKCPNRPIGWKPIARKSISGSPFRSAKSKKISDRIKLLNKFEARNALSFTARVDLIELDLQEMSENTINNKVEQKSCRKRKYSQDLTVISESIDTNITSNGLPNHKPNNSEPNSKKNKNCYKLNIREKLEIKPNKKLVKDNEQMNSINDIKDKILYLEKKIEFNEKMHCEHIREVQHNADLVLVEVRQSWVAEKERALNEEKKKFKQIINEREKQFKSKFDDLNEKHELEVKLLEQKYCKQLSENKTKNWCFNCLNEAKLYCCAHTYYCSYECRTSHWKDHESICTERKPAVN